MLTLEGRAAGRRYATQQINRAYAVLLASEFQGCCRDLHSECVEHVIAATPGHLQDVIRLQFLWGLQLDRGNAQAGAIGSDFGRFGLAFWEDVYTLHTLHSRRRELLDELMRWRNAIAHNDFDPDLYGPDPVLHLNEVRQWRSALNGLSQAFDTVMRNQLNTMVGAAPWPP